MTRQKLTTNFKLFNLRHLGVVILQCQYFLIVITHRNKTSTVQNKVKTLRSPDRQRYKISYGISYVFPRLRSKSDFKYCTCDIFDKKNRTKQETMLNTPNWRKHSQNDLKFVIDDTIFQHLRGFLLIFGQYYEQTLINVESRQSISFY